MFKGKDRNIVLEIRHCAVCSLQRVGYNTLLPSNTQQLTNVSILFGLINTQECQPYATILDIEWQSDTCAMYSLWHMLLYI